jgi:hypothetical protein
MEPTKHDVLGVIETYIRAWVEQDPDLILTVFTETATYHERVLDEPIRDHAGIRKYWHTKVLRSQRNITCKLLHLYLEGNTAIARTVPRTVFSARHAGLRSGGMGTVSDDIERCESTEEDRR